MRREFHVRFCEGGGVRFPSATRPVLVFTHEEDARRVMERLAEALEPVRPDATPDQDPSAPVPAPWVGKEPKMASGARSFDFLGFTHYWGRSQAGSGGEAKTASSRLGRRCALGVAEGPSARPVAWQHDGW